MDDEKIMVPYIVHEGAMARAERHIKRLVIALVISIIVLLLSNLAWLWMWSSYEYVGEETTYTQDGGGVNIIGDENKYESDSEKSDEIPQEEER